MTTAQEIEKLMNDYRAWLKDRTTLREINNTWVEITTPYLDRHNDAIQIYARANNGGYILTDDNYTIHDLEASGCNLNTDKRRELLKMTLRGFGVQLKDDALEVHASPETFPARKHSLIQAILAVNDLFYLAQPIVESLFYEDVVEWLDANNIRYTPNAKFTGISAFDHLFDFVIPKSRTNPERILQVVNRPTRDNAEAFIYAWSDTQQNRPPRSRAYAVLNDKQHQVSSGVLEAFRNYDIQPVPWSHRDQVIGELSG